MAEIKTPENLSYAKSHEWVKVEGNVSLIGLTDFAQDALGDIVFVNLPEEGDEFEAGETFADVESVKAVSDVYCPISGTVVEVNEELLDDPALFLQLKTSCNLCLRRWGIRASVSCMRMYPKKSILNRLILIQGKANSK